MRTGKLETIKIDLPRNNHVRKFRP